MPAILQKYRQDGGHPVHGEIEQESDQVEVDVVVVRLLDRMPELVVGEREKQAPRRRRLPRG